QMIKGEFAIQGNSNQNVARLRMGFADDLFVYSISLGYPEPSLSAFSLEPEIKRETIWAGDVYKAHSVLVDRTGPLVKV
ncbi:ATP-binding protein, partial [Francisella tularensis subsp. holarctica]|nr:ATP-binding protein [Francisella tularensis subsp. holarctica]